MSPSDTALDLAKFLARKIFECPHGCKPDEVSRIQFRTNAERDLGGLCESALAGVIADALKRRAAHERHTAARSPGPVDPPSHWSLLFVPNNEGDNDKKVLVYRLRDPSAEDPAPTPAEVEHLAEKLLDERPLLREYWLAACVYGPLMPHDEHGDACAVQGAI